MMRRIGLLAVALAGPVAVVCSNGAAADGPQKRLPVPLVTIMPGDPITEEKLVERAFAPNFPGASTVVDSMQLLIGRVARRTLLPGQPIQWNSVGDPRVVTRGVPVKVVVEDEGLVIITYGSPLQSGGVGAHVRVRNLDTGVIVNGIVHPDGTVRVGNG